MKWENSVQVDGLKLFMPQTLSVDFSKETLNDCFAKYNSQSGHPDNYTLTRNKIDYKWDWELDGNWTLKDLGVRPGETIVGMMRSANVAHMRRPRNEGMLRRSPSKDSDENGCFKV